MEDLTDEEKALLIEMVRERHYRMEVMQRNDANPRIKAVAKEEMDIAMNLWKKLETS